VGDPRLDEPRRWGVFWIHHEAEELQVHHRTTIPAGDARALVVTLLASGRSHRYRPLPISSISSPQPRGRSCNGSGAPPADAARLST
jgi:hypothetical protein